MSSDLNANLKFYSKMSFKDSLFYYYVKNGKDMKDSDLIENIGELREFYHKKNSEVFPDILRDDEEFVITEYKENPNHGIEFASKRLKKDSSFLKKYLELLTKRTESLEFLEYTFDEEDLESKENVIFLLSVKNIELKDASPELQKDEEVIKTAVENNCFDYSSLPESYRNDREFLLSRDFSFINSENLNKELIEDQDFMLKGISKGIFKTIDSYIDKYKEDREMVTKIAIHTPKDEAFCPPEKFKNDFELAKKVIASGGRIENFREVIDEIVEGNDELLKLTVLNTHNLWCFRNDITIDDEEIMRDLIRRESVFKVLKFASERLKDEKDIVLEAISSNEDNLIHASNRLRDDREVVLEAVRRSKNHWTKPLRMASERLRDDKEFILEAMSIDKESFQFASYRLRDDREVVLKAYRMKRCTFCIFEYVSDRLKKDIEIVLEAVEDGCDSLMWVPEEFLDDYEIMFAAVKKSCYALRFASDRLKDNFDLVEKATAQDGRQIKLASERLRDNKEMVKMCLEYGGLSYIYASERLRKDREIYLEAIKAEHAPWYVYYEIFSSDREIVLQWFNLNTKMELKLGDFLDLDAECPQELPDYRKRGKLGEFNFSKVHESLRDDREVMTAAMKWSPESLKFFSEESRNNKEIVLEAISENPRAIEFAPEQFKDDRRLVRVLVYYQGKLLKYASENLKRDPELIRIATRYDKDALSEN